MKRFISFLAVIWVGVFGWNVSAVAQVSQQTQDPAGVIILVHPQENEMSFAREKLLNTPACKLTGFVRKDGKMYLTIVTDDKKPATVQKVKDKVKQDFATPELLEVSSDELQKLREKNNNSNG